MSLGSARGVVGSATTCCAAKLLAELCGKEKYASVRTHAQLPHCFGPTIISISEVSKKGKRLLLLSTLEY